MMSIDLDFEDDEWIEDEGDEDDVYLSCPFCHEDVHEDTQQCPSCGDWIIPVDPRQRTQKIIWAIAAMLIIASMFMFVVF